MRTRHYCTYFDHNYLPRGLALYHSLRRQSQDFQLWVLCLSDECDRILERMNLPNLHRIRMEDFERDDAPLRAAKANRSRVEYFFTCTPSLPLFVLDRDPAADMVTYLDADLYFFGDPETVFEEIGDRSIAIIDHRFPPELRERLLPHGRYNVGWVSFRRDEPGIACLRWWRERCLEWCHDRVDGDRFADQKYLEKFPSLFGSNVADLRHKGANTAPYNIANYTVRSDDAGVWIDDDPLVFFHFHGFNQVRPCVFDPYFHKYGVRMTPVLREAIVRPYARAYAAALREVRPYLSRGGVRFKTRGSNRRISLRNPLKFLLNEWLVLYEQLKYIKQGDYLLLMGPNRTAPEPRTHRDSASSHRTG